MFKIRLVVDHLKIKKNHLRTISILLVSFILIFGTVFAFADDENKTEPVPEEDVNVSVLRVSPSDTSGFHAVMLTLIGDYNPIVKDYTYQSTNGYTNHSIDIQPDWSWICTCAVFAIIIFSLFRLVGGLFSCKR